MRVRYSPLGQQFAEPDEIFDELKSLVRSGDFTLGKPVAEFEAMFAEALGIRHAVGVGSGTDALKVPLRSLGVGHGDEVVTCANTFWATVGAIAEVGAQPRFVDCDDSFCLDVGQLEAAVTPRTKAIMPVHLTGNVADMPRVMAIAERHGIPVVEDACQSLLGEIDGRRAGTFGVAAGFSAHPLKIINVWGDAGIIVTNDADVDRRLRLLRNHGLAGRDEMEMLGYNTRLDSVQAVVGKWIIRQVNEIVTARIERARYYDAGFIGIPGLRIPPRDPRIRNVYLLYILFAEDRDRLLRHCLDAGIEAKVHYPLPLYRQKPLAFLGHREGDFPVTDRHAREMITLPVDQHLSRAEQDYVIETIRNFYLGKQR
jgi:dTDP-4-amino-4,6-dideoxygalactose transaminase